MYNPYGYGYPPPFIQFPPQPPAGMSPIKFHRQLRKFMKEMEEDEKKKEEDKKKKDEEAKKKEPPKKKGMDHSKLNIFLVSLLFSPVLGMAMVHLWQYSYTSMINVIQQMAK